MTPPEELTLSQTQPYAATPPTRFRMRPSRVLRTIREGKVARVLKLNISDAKIAEIFAAAQPDALWLCMEHTSATWEQVENQIRAAKLYDVDTLLRVSRGSYSDYIRGYEMDATGLIVPHVMNADDARKVRDITKFAPLGKRAVDGGNNDAQFCRRRTPSASPATRSRTRRRSIMSMRSPRWMGWIACSSAQATTRRRAAFPARSSTTRSRRCANASPRWRGSTARSPRR